MIITKNFAKNLTTDIFANIASNYATEFAALLGYTSQELLKYDGVFEGGIFTRAERITNK